jgi:hypothetical protein
MAGCGLLASPTPAPTPTTHYRPEVIGIVESTELLGDMRVRLILSGGERIDVDRAVDVALQDTDPVAGDLLFYGTDPEAWFYAEGPGPSRDCYLVQGLIEGDVGADELHFDFGLVLTKADDFDPGSANFRRPGGSAFCVNAEGQVTRLYE